MPLENLSQVLLHATYKEGQASQQNLTEAHFWAEHHPYKIEYLFVKDKKIPKHLYTARLIQHYYIFKALEAALYAHKNDVALAPFFALDFAEHLQRASKIAKDLKKLGIDSEKIRSSVVTDATQRYVQHLSKLTPKLLLIHYAVQAAGLMFGGPIIKSRYFKASDQLPGYSVPVEEYDFSEALTAAELKGVENAGSLFNKLNSALTEISVDPSESGSLLEEGLSAYSYMVEIYSDLLWNEVYLKQIRYAAFFIATAGAAIMAWSMQECAKVSVSHCFGV